MKIAIEEAKIALEKGEIPVGAVIIKNDQIVARAHNRKEELHKATAHAEILAIEAASEKLQTWRLSECTMYVTLEPCHMCMAAIIESRIKHVVYGALDYKMGAHISNRSLLRDRLNGNFDIVGGVMEEESEKLLKDFFLTLRKR